MRKKQKKLKAYYLPTAVIFQTIKDGVTAMAEKQKHIPLRKCMGCQEMLPKQSLIRIVKDSEGIKLDPTGKADGRGAYLCGKGDCLKRVIKSRRLDKVLHSQIPAEIYTKLEELSSNMEVR